MSRLRRDPASARWVVFPDDEGRLPLPEEAPAVPAPAPQFCPFCPGMEDKTPNELFSVRERGTEPNQGGWRLRVVPNRFPVLTSPGRVERSPRGIYDSLAGVGVHEIVVEHADHDADLAGYPVDHAELVVRAWAERYAELAADGRMRTVLLFRNRPARGAKRRPHVCSELVALPVVPRRLEDELRRARRHWEWKERCLFCDQLRAELNDGRRLVARNELFAAFVPFAARSPHEVQIHPLRHQADFRSLGDDEARALAALLVEVHGRLDRRIGSRSLAMMLHAAPCHLGELPYYHWHFECLPEMDGVSAFEWATGFYVNPAAPEAGARSLREAVDGEESE